MDWPGNRGTFGRMNGLPRVLISCLAATLALAGCAQVRSWIPLPRAAASARSPLGTLAQARTGQPAALHEAFLAARARLSQPAVLREEETAAFRAGMASVLHSVGDSVFAAALRRESPKTRSAVRDSLTEKEVKGKFPQTRQLLHEAPVVKWPSALAAEQRSASTGAATVR